MTTKYAIIDNNVVNNIILADSEFMNSLGVEFDIVPEDVHVDIGWNYAGGSFIAPTSPITYLDKNALISEIKTYRDNRESTSGVLAPSVNKWFQTDVNSRIQYIGLVNIGDSIPSTLKWKSMDGSFVSMTKELANEIFNAVISMDITIFANAEKHIAIINTSGDLESYDYSTGWPVSYADSIKQ